jgi:signal transduction histidine kinase/putative methionine-R-sulfoxide reductase with GAF domain
MKLEKFLLTNGLVGVIVQNVANIPWPFGPSRISMSADQCQKLLAELTEKNAKLKLKLKELNSLYQSTKLMTSIQDLNELLSGIIRLAARVLQAKTASLMLLAEDTNELRIMASKGLDAKTARSVRMKIGEGIAGYVMEYGKPLLVKNIEKDSRFRRMNREKYETKSLISVPLATKGKVFGVLNLNNKRSGKPFTEADLRLLTAFAAQAAVAVDNVYLLEQNRRKIQELSILYDIAKNVSAADGLKQAVESIFSGIGQVVEIDHCYWFLWEKRYRRLSLAFSMVPQGSVSQRMEGREIYLTEDLTAQLKDRRRDQLNRTIRDFLVDSKLCDPQLPLFDSFPITMRGELHGLFCAGSTSLQTISESELQLIAIIISQAAFLYEQHSALTNAAHMMTMSKVASEIAHDLRHPLTNIKGILQVLETKWYDADFRQESLQLIHQEIYRLTDLTKELVRFSSPSRFQVKNRDIHQILEKALNLVDHDLRRGKIELCRNFDPDLPFVCVDENEVLDVFLNILLNSIESMYHGGKLTISTDLRDHLRDESGTLRVFIRVKFTDTGEGIAPEHRARIFERYFTTKESGTGLGLSIARRIVAAHRGFIEVHSVPEKGSTFSVHFPV